ncbi:hypothetical protein A8W25_16030 [Streptomyces sp. ERV7]|uniref:hypothetical protein n=1 Tax=Streptomyces sp. ERV7 TaxID=1322334 RepID=UPI0007F54684|nr:hypothetical protein [Streptomyces sp. ERV7]OAR23979.1 hypothetical protein A8W25_16030 [Streptomyces sp. ERV7]
MVQINQAGAALAIWFSRPPKDLDGVDGLKIRDGTGGVRTADHDWVHGVARGFLVDKTNGNRAEKGAPIPLTWFVAEGANVPPDPLRPTATDLFNPLDPWLSEGTPPLVRGFKGKGLLSYPKETPEVLLLSFAEDGRPTLKLRRTSPVVRWPRRVISRLPEPLRTQVLMDQTRPVPVALQTRMISLFASPNTGFARSIATWARQKAGTIERTRTRVALARALEFSLAEPWRSRMYGLMALYGNFARLEVDGELKTYYGWLNDVLDDEVRNSTAGGYLPGWGTGRVQETIRSLGVGGEASFLYRLTFQDVGFAGPLVGIQAGAYASVVKIDKFRLVFKRNNDGSRVYDKNGQPVTEDPVPVPWVGNHPVFGVFARLAAGLAADVGVKSIVVKNVAGKPGLGVADLGKIDFRSELDLSDPADFSGARIVIASTTVGKVKLGNLGQANISDSALWQLYLPGHGWMHSITEADHLSGPRLPFSWGALLTPGWWKNWLPTSAEGTALRVSLCVGALFSTGAPTTKPPSGHEDKVENLLAGQSSAMFPYDSWDLDAEEPGSETSGRMRFERDLAEVRAVIEAYGPAPVLLAFTSPEGTEPHNDVLSENRAVATGQAIVDALGAHIARDGFVVAAHGEYPARARGDLTIQGIPVTGGGLPDPEKYPTRDDFYRSADGPTAKEWPRWRRVDLFVEGTLVTRVLGRDSTP